MIFVECYTDLLLVKELGVPRKSIAHESGKGNVVNKVKNEKKRAMGIVDEDPGSPDPKDMSNYVEEVSEASLKFMSRKNDDSKKLVVVSPYLEHWLLARARANKIDPATFGVPSDPKELHKIARIDLKPNFREFLELLISVDQGIKTLKKWIKESAK